ncbi:MAG: PilZ domain-containing protein [Oligoflexia bacterium]|nr:PilZ domain-containing protein [Oligoflexia bacterium]
MKTRPWPLILLALFYLAAPVLNLLMSASILHVPPGRYLVHLLRADSAWGLFTFFALPPIAGAAIWVMKKWSYPVFFLATLLLAFSNFQTWQSHPKQMGLPVLLLTYAVNLALVAYFMLPSVRKVYTDKRLRWWEAKPRFMLEIPALLKGTFGEKRCTLVDFSEGGAFVKSSRKLVSEGSLQLSFSFLGRSFEFEAKAVHYRSKGSRGYGLQFVHTDRSRGEAVKLATALRALERETPGRQPGPESAFSHWAVNLLRTGHGLVPEVPIQPVVEAKARPARPRVAKVVKLETGRKTRVRKAA